MDSARALSIGFLRSQPKGAVPVLETIAPADAAAFLKHVPDDVAGRAFEFMQPLLAAAILGALTSKKAAAILLTMDVHGRLHIMRLLDDDLMKAIMDQMPKGAARDLARFLNYPEGSVGAWMSSDAAVFERAVRVRDCLAQLRSLSDKVRNLLFIIDGQKRFLGAVELTKLIAAQDENSVESVADTSIKRLSPYARLASVAALPAWDTALSLPVVDSKGRLIGTLHFDHLRKGLAAEQRAKPEKHIGQITVHLAEAFLVCAAGLLQGSLSKPTLSRSASELET